MQLIYPDKDSSKYPAADRAMCEPSKNSNACRLRLKPAGHMPQVWPSDFKDFQTQAPCGPGHQRAGGRRWIRLTRRGAIAAAAAAAAAAAKSKVFNIGGISPPLATTKPIWQYFKTLK